MTAPSTGAVVLRCPVHGIPDCSPLLNGCSIPNAVRALIAEAAAKAWDEGEQAGEKFERARWYWQSGNRAAMAAAGMPVEHPERPVNPYRDGGR